MKKTKQADEKSRKFIYHVTNTDIEDIQHLKTIECKYHKIIIHPKINDSKLLCGFLYFNSPRTVNSIRNMIGLDNLIDVSFYKIHNCYSCQTHCQTIHDCSIWEYGNEPRYGRTKIRICAELSNQESSNENQESSSENQESSQDYQMTPFEERLLRIFEQQTQQLTNVVKDLTEKVEKVEKVTTTNNTINSNNTINNTVNNNNTINVFLNEDCKHAITIDKLLEDIIITKADLYEMRKYGLENVMTTRFLRELEQYDITTRPVHCTDLSRESIHVKKANGWVKEIGNKDSNLTTAAREIARKSNCIMLEMYDNNPDYSNAATKRFDEGLELHLAVSGNGKPIKAIAEAFQRNIAKHVYINAKMIKEMKH